MLASILSLYGSCVLIPWVISQVLSSMLSLYGSCVLIPWALLQVLVSILSSLYGSCVLIPWAISQVLASFSPCMLPMFLSRIHSNEQGHINPLAIVKSHKRVYKNRLNGSYPSKRYLCLPWQALHEVKIRSKRDPSWVQPTLLDLFQIQSNTKHTRNKKDIIPRGFCGLRNRHDKKFICSLTIDVDKSNSR